MFNILVGTLGFYFIVKHLVKSAMITQENKELARKFNDEFYYDASGVARDINTGKKYVPKITGTREMTLEEYIEFTNGTLSINEARRRGIRI